MKRTKRFYFGVAASVLALCLLILGVWSVFIEPNSVVVREYVLQLPRWPTAFDRMRIVVISDLHVGSPHITTGKLRQVVATVNELNPDVVLIPGDFVIGGVLGGHFVGPELIAAELKNLRAASGVYAVLGNHDWWYDGKRMIHALNAVGIRVLEDDTVLLQQNEGSLWLVGLADYWTRSPNVANTLQNIPDGDAVIAFTHNPDLFTKIPSHVNLTLAGHTHGGQVNLPLLGRLVVPSDYGQRYAAGHIEEGGRHLFVTPGVGTSILPVRFRVPPEISVLTITR